MINSTPRKSPVQHNILQGAALHVWINRGSRHEAALAVLWERDGTGRDGTGDGTGWDGMGRDGMGWDGDGTGRDELGRSQTGPEQR